MPNTYGELLRGQLENRTANPTPTTATKGRMWYRTDLTDMFIDTGSVAARFPWDLQSLSANPAASGVILLASQDKISWRNNANGADLPLSTDASDNLTYNSHAFLSSAGVVPVAAGGTNVTGYTTGDLLYASSSTVLAKLGIGSSNQLLQVIAGVPTWQTVTASYTAPTLQKFLSTGSTTGYLFTISTSSTVVAGDTYTNNGNTYTVLAALTAQSGQVLYTSQAAAPAASGNLIRATGAGTATIAFTSSVALATYTKPANVLYLKIKISAGGGGGSGGGSNTAGTGGTGGTSVFGSLLIVCNGGVGAVWDAANGGVGGTASLGTGPIGLALSGGTGGAGGSTGGLSFTPAGTMGGANPLGGAGGGGNGAAGAAGTTNTGAGGGGGGTTGSGTDANGSGGGAGGYIEALITSSLQSTYVYCIGAGGSAGTAGATGAAGGAGAAGLLEVIEFYQ